MPIRKLRALDENTTVSLGLMIAIVALVFWLASVSFRGDANAESIKELRDEQKDYAKEVRDINNRLYNIEGALGVKFRKPRPGDEGENHRPLGR